MALSRVVALSALSLFAIACSAKTTTSPTDPSTLGTNEDALTTDNSDSQEAEDGTEDGIENGLSGATPTDTGNAVDGVDLATIDAKMKVNPGLYFMPAGCIVSTRIAAGQWSHVFTNCTGPLGRVTYNGTVTSTWTVSAGSFQVVHAATSFTEAGPNVTVTFGGSRTVTYTRAGSVLSKHRVGSWTGTLSKNANPSKTEPWSHNADFTSTWDESSKCYTRDGSADNAIGGREFGRKVTGYKVCGGLFACPSSGELEVDRKDGSVTITIDFLGGQNVEVTGPKGNSIKVKIACIVE
jgi:hypothetical protein